MKLKELEDECKGIAPAGSMQQSMNNGSTTITNRTVNSSMSGNHSVPSGFFNGQNASGSNYYGNKN